MGVPGDYNGDGIPNAPDFTIWGDNRGAIGTPGTVPGDGTGDDLLGVPDGDVDDFDYLFWVQEVVNAGTGSSATIPEPTTSALVVVLLACTALSRRRPAAYTRP